jgi:hypothetical protein
MLQHSVLRIALICMLKGNSSIHELTWLLWYKKPSMDHLCTTSLRDCSSRRLDADYADKSNVEGLLG